MQKRNPPLSQLNSEQIIAAYQIILNPNCDQETIKKADTFLNQCELNPQFPLSLMQIIAHTNKTQTQRQAILHLTNVIKRYWTNKRRVHNVIYLSEQTKQSIKNGLIQLYKMYWSTYYKDFNQIFKFLAKYQFPSNYPSLKNFMVQILRTMANSDIQAVIAPAQLLPYLSLVKTVFKQNANRRYQHTRQIYHEHIAQNVRLSVQILQKINNAINSIKNTNEQILDVRITNKLLQCSRKIDKIILYCLQCAVSTMQTDSQISQIIEYMINKIQLLLQIRFNSIRQEVQLNIYAILQNISKLQVQLPFALTNFLAQYFGVIINLLINQNFNNQNLTNCVITSNTKPFVTFEYYSNQTYFKESIHSKKGLGANYINEQAKCHHAFLEIYGGQNSATFMEKAITQLMNKYRKHDDLDSYMFQENEHQEVASEYSSFELLLLLLKNLMARFKQEFKVFVSKILDHLLVNKLPASSSQVVLNMYQIVLLSPKVYDETSLQLDKVFELMQLNFNNQDFLIFSRLIRNYNSYFNMSTIYKSFQILINIIATPNIDHQVIYQCGVCIKKMLSEHEEGELPLDNIGLCLGNLFSLVYVYKNTPSHLWTLLQLINQILKLVNNEVMVNNLGYILESVNYLIDLKDNGQLTIYGTADLLQNILQLIQPEQIGNQQTLQTLNQTAIKLIGKYIYNREIESVETLYRLWLSVAKNVSASKNSRGFVQKLANALQAMRNKLIKDDPVVFLEITQQYILGGLISPTLQDIQQLGQQILRLVRLEMSQQDSNGWYRLIMAFFSVYFSYFLTTGNYIPNLIVILMKFIQQFHNKMSQQINLLRSFLMVVLNHHIIVLGPQKIFQLLNSAHNNNYKQWYWPYIWCSEYLNNKYSCKVSSIALLSSLEILHQANILLPEIQEHTPLLRIMKAASFNVESINVVTAMNCYMSSFTNMMQSQQKKSRLKFGIAGLKSTPRKYKVHVNSEWAQCDVSDIYREKFSLIITNLGWNIQTIETKFDKQGSAKIISLLTGTKNNDQN